MVKRLQPLVPPFGSQPLDLLVRRSQNGRHRPRCRFVTGRFSSSAPENVPMATHTKCPACQSLIPLADRRPNGLLVCPDCGTTLKIKSPPRPPAEPAPRKATAADDDLAQLADEDAPPAPGAPEPPRIKRKKQNKKQPARLTDRVSPWVL